MGEGIDSVEVSEILVNVGDQIAIDDAILILESEKASMEIPTTEAGTIAEINVNAGDEIGPGALLLKLEGESKSGVDKSSEKTTEKTVDKQPEPSNLQTTKKAEMDPGQPTKNRKTGVSPLASPAVRRFARELGAELAGIAGSGEKGRITKEDVQNYIKSALTNLSSGPNTKPAMPKIDFSQWGEVETVKLSKIKRITGERLQQAWQTIPHVTQYDEADITDLEIFRKSLKALNANKKTRVTLLPFIMKAVAQCMDEMPEFNASLDHTGQNLVYKKYIHLGVAVDTPDGLVVPVVRNVDQKNFRELSEELATTSEKARNKKLLPEDMKGGCFTISSLGGISGTGFSPIVNPPEVAILGVSRAKTKPVFKDESFGPRIILPFSLSYDHRVIDGAQAARFTRRINELLTDFKELKGLGLT